MGGRVKPGHTHREHAVDILSNLFTDFVDTALRGLFDVWVTYDTIVRGGRWFAVMLGSCSLSTIYVDGVDAGVDRHTTWANGEECIQALAARPLGPNVAAFTGRFLRAAHRTPSLGAEKAELASVG